MLNSLGNQACINSRLQISRLCNRYRIATAAVTSNASIRGKRVGDIGMLKMGVLACLLGGKGKIVGGVVGDVVVLLSCVRLGSYVNVGVYREKEGEETGKHNANRCNTVRVML
jgi:hypothetical protein